MIDALTFPQAKPQVYTSSQTLISNTDAKTRTISQRIIETVGRWIRDLFFLPISANLPSSSLAILNREREFVQRFWNPACPLDMNYPLQEEIRKAFRVYDQPIQIAIDGEKLEAKCRIIESKEEGESYINFVQVLGSLSTIETDVTTTYPFLAEYLKRRKEDPSLPPARFILISHYNTSSEEGLWKPKTIAQWGEALSKIVEALSKKFNHLNCIIGHSNGTLPLAGAVNSLVQQALPSLLCFERGPSSIESVSKGYCGGRILHFLAKNTGWTTDLGKELHTFYQKHPNSSCIVSGVSQDFYFPGEAGLPEHPLIAELEKESKVKVFLFNPPNQLFHPRAHHNLRADLLHGNYLIRATNKTEMENKSLASVIFSNCFSTGKDLERTQEPFDKSH